MVEPAKRRGRPAGAKNKPAAKPVEAPAAVGHNDDRERAIFLQMLRQAESATEAVKEAQKELKDVFKKADEFGISVSDLKWALKQRTADQGKEQAKLERQLRLARFMGLPYGTQIGLFEAAVSPSEVEKAFDAGKQAGMEGKTCISPYSPELEQSRKWIEGWHAGQDVLKSAFLKHNGAELIQASEQPAAPDPFNEALAEAALDPREMVLETEGEAPADLAPPTWPDGLGEEEDVRPAFLIQQGDDDQAESDL